LKQLYKINLYRLYFVTQSTILKGMQTEHPLQYASPLLNFHTHFQEQIMY